MSDIIPRKKVIPVQARRMDPQPPMIQIPGADPIPAPPMQPGVTQNIIYVTLPAQTPPPQPAAPPQSAQPSGPQEIHVHNTHVHNYARRRGQRLGSSFLGSLGLFLGLAAMAAAYMPATVAYAKVVAEAGAVCSGVGLLGAMVFGRVGRGLPFFALLVCGAGFGMWAKNTGNLPGVPGLDVVSSPQQPAAAKPAPGSPPQPPAQSPSLDVPPPSPAGDPNRLHDHTIFGDGQGTWVKPTTPAVPAAPIVAPSPAVPAAPAVDLATARTNLELARTAAATRMHLDYASARLANDTAQSEYEQAKIASSPGSVDLIAASQKHLQTESQLNAILTKLRTDPQVAAAEAVITSATPAR